MFRVNVSFGVMGSHSKDFQEFSAAVAVVKGLSAQNWDVFGERGRVRGLGFWVLVLWFRVKGRQVVLMPVS